MERVGKNLATANTAYNQMVGSFNDKLVPQARRFEQLGSGSAKQLPDPPTVETTPKTPTRLSPPKPTANEDDAAA